MAILENKFSDFEGDEASYFQYSEIFPVKEKLQEHCMIVLIFSALSLEGYIYDYAARNLSDSFVDQHLDKLDVVSKWVIVPKLVTGFDFPKDQVAFQLLKKIVKNRNFIVHNKSNNVLTLNDHNDEFKLSDGAKRIYAFSSNIFNEASDAIRAIDELAITMENLDPNEKASFTAHQSLKFVISFGKVIRP